MNLFIYYFRSLYNVQLRNMNHGTGWLPLYLMIWKVLSTCLLVHFDNSGEVCAVTSGEL